MRRITTWLAALEPKIRVNLTHFHGVFAPNSKCRQPVGWAPAGCLLRSIWGASLVRMLSTAVCW